VSKQVSVEDAIKRLHALAAELGLGPIAAHFDEVAKWRFPSLTYLGVDSNKSVDNWTTAQHFVRSTASEHRAKQRLAATRAECEARTPKLVADMAEAPAARGWHAGGVASPFRLDAVERWLARQAGSEDRPTLTGFEVIESTDLGPVEGGRATAVVCDGYRVVFAPVVCPTGRYAFDPIRPSEFAFCDWRHAVQSVWGKKEATSRAIFSAGQLRAVCAFTRNNSVSLGVPKSKAGGDAVVFCGERAYAQKEPATTGVVASGGGVRGDGFSGLQVRFIEDFVRGVPADAPVRVEWRGGFDPVWLSLDDGRAAMVMAVRP